MVRLTLILGISLASNCLSSNPDWDEAAEEGSSGGDASTSTTMDAPSSTTSAGTSSPSSTTAIASTTAATDTTSSGEETAASSSTGDPLPDGRVVDGLATLFTFIYDEAGPSTVFDVAGVDPPLDLTISATSMTTWTVDGLRIDAASTLTTVPVVPSRFGTQGFTVELWVDSQSPTAGLEDGPRIVAFEDHLTAWSNFHVSGGSGIIGLFVLVDESGDTDRFILDVEPGLRHVVFTVSATGELRGYEDGELEVLGMLPAATPMLWQDGIPFVVANASDSGHPWVGLLGLLAIYERALSAQEVLHNFEQGR